MTDPHDPSPSSFRRASRRLVRTLVATVFLGVASSVQADLGSPVTVSLIAPGGIVGDSILTPIIVVDTVTTAAGIHPKDGTGIGDSWMLESEYIEFSVIDNLILLRVAAGAEVGGSLVTGYLGFAGEHARYEFTGLDILNATIVGFAAGATGIATPADPHDFIHLLTANSISIDLDSLVFNPVDGESNAGGDLWIRLLTSENPPTVPEPTSIAIVLVGLAGLMVTRRRTAVAHRRNPNI